MSVILVEKPSNPNAATLEQLKDYFVKAYGKNVDIKVFSKNRDSLYYIKVYYNGLFLDTYMIEIIREPSKTNKWVKVEPNSDINIATGKIRDNGVERSLYYKGIDKNGSKAYYNIKSVYRLADTKMIAIPDLRYYTA